MRFISESDDSGHWTCYREGRPELSAGGKSAASAFARCCAIHQVEPDPVQCSGSGNRVTFIVGTPCPDCGGSGRYVGLTVDETCRTCQGRGARLRESLTDFLDPRD